jgi:hypothetical protein
MTAGISTAAARVMAGSEGLQALIKQSDQNPYGHSAWYIVNQRMLARTERSDGYGVLQIL